MGSFRKNGCEKATFGDIVVFTPTQRPYQAREGWPEVGRKYAKSLMISVKPMEKKNESLGL